MDDSRQDFKYRNTNRVDIAHIKATEFLKKNKIFYKEIGFDSKNDKIPFEKWFKVPSFIRNLPDMFVITNRFSFLEIKGCKNTVKIKFEDYINYVKWDSIAPLMFFIYSTTKDKMYLLHMKNIDYLYRDSDQGIYKDNNKRYFEIDLNNMKKWEERNVD
jgi:hypothetical protein